MTWIFFATLSYFLGAVTVILDKYLLGSKRIASPPNYAFFVGLAGMGVLLFAPLGFFFAPFHLFIPSAHQLVLSFFSGFTMVAGFLALYFAIKKAQASKVTPVVFSVVPLVTFLLGILLQSEKFSVLNLWGIALLVFGGLLISFDLPLKLGKRKFFTGFKFALAAGFLLGISMFILKFVYLQQNFFNGYVWTRMGAFLGALTFFLVPVWRKNILRSFKNSKKNKKQNLQTGIFFLLNKIIGGSSSALVNLAVSAGSVTLVTAMVSLQYVFVLVLAVFVGKRLPHVFEEKLLFWDWAQKIVAIVIIGVGIFFIV